MNEHAWDAFIDIDWCIVAQDRQYDVRNRRGREPPNLILYTPSGTPVRGQGTGVWTATRGRSTGRRR